MFDEPDNSKNVLNDEYLKDPVEDFASNFLNFLYKGFSKLLGSAQDANNQVLAPAISKYDFTTKDENGKINGGYELDTTDDVTVKTRYNADGSVDESLSEQWTDRFENYTKVWTAPNGEQSILKASGKVSDNGDGTFNVPVKRTGIGASDEIFTLVLDKNGNEVNRFDAIGNRYDSSGSLTRKSYTTKDADGNITGGYELDLTGGKTSKIRYNADSTVDNSINETWISEYKDYKKEWNGPNGEKTVLESTGVVDNGNGTFNVTVKRTDARYPDKIFTMVMDANGKEIDRFDEEGNHYDSNGALVKESEEVPVPETTTSPIEVQPVPQKDEVSNKETAPVETPKPIETTAPIEETQAPVEPGTDTPVDVAPKEKGLTKAGMYWAKTEYVNGQTVKTLYYDEAGTRIYSKIMQNDTSGRKIEEFYNEAGKKTSSTATSPAGVCEQMYDDKERVKKKTLTQNGITTVSDYTYADNKTTEKQTTKTASGSDVTVIVNGKKTTESKYNPKGLILSEIKYNADGKTVSTNTAYAYNKSGNLAKKVTNTPNDKAGNNPCASTTTTTYNYDKSGKRTGSKVVKEYGGGNFNNLHGWTEICDVSGKVIKWSSSNTLVGQTLGPWNKPSGEHQ